jgi:hypothetical protein
MQRLKDKDERQINFGYRLLEPIFLKELRIFRMPDKRQVCVQNEAEISGWNKVSGREGLP